MPGSTRQSCWMLVAAFLFAMMGVCVKLASPLYSTSEIVMYRGAVGVVMLFIWIRWQGGTLATTMPWEHAKRGAFGTLALWLWFYSISLLPLATAMTLNYLSPVWIALMLLAAGIATRSTPRHRADWRMSAAIVVSFLGVALLLQPSFHAGQGLGGAIGLVSGALSAMAYLMVKRLGQRGEPEYRVVFYFSAAGVVAGLLANIISNGGGIALHTHDPRGAALLLGTGVCATLAQMALTRAYRLGKTLVTANLQYTGIVFSSAWGILLWQETPGLSGWIGIGLILASGSAATWFNTRVGNRTAASDGVPPASSLKETSCVTPP